LVVLDASGSQNAIPSSFSWRTDGAVSDDMNAALSQSDGSVRLALDSSLFANIDTDRFTFCLTVMGAWPDSLSEACHTLYRDESVNHQVRIQGVTEGVSVKTVSSERLVLEGEVVSACGMDATLGMKFLWTTTAPEASVNAILKAYGVDAMTNAKLQVPPGALPAGDWIFSLMACAYNPSEACEESKPVFVTVLSTPPVPKIDGTVNGVKLQSDLITIDKDTKVVLESARSVFPTRGQLPVQYTAKWACVEVAVDGASGSLRGACPALSSATDLSLSISSWQPGTMTFSLSVTDSE